MYVIGIKKKHPYTPIKNFLKDTVKKIKSQSSDKEVFAKYV